MKRDNFFFTLLLAGTVLLFGSAAVHAQATIDQNKALAGSVTPGDAPGFPVNINLPGSYKLMGNLVAPPGSKGIVITVDGVTLDMNGFTITGPITCDVSALPECTGGNTGTSGIESSGARTVVRNGTVRGFEGDGIYMTSMLDVVENMVVESNSGSGININAKASLYAYAATRISRTMVTQNKMNGIAVSQGFAVTVDDTVTSKNGGSGIALNAGSLKGVTALYNGTYGLVAGGAVQITGSRFEFNKLGSISGPARSGGGNLDVGTLF